MNHPNVIPAEPDFLLDYIEPHYLEACQLPVAETAADTILSLSELAMRFADVERVPRYDETRRENDAEHSFMLSLVACELAVRYFPDLDAGLVAQFSTVHDLIELETDDVATFALSDESLATKEAAEHRASHGLSDKLPPHTRELFLRYEAQKEPETRFVRLVDKILPVVVNILGPGKKVMHEDFEIRTDAHLAVIERLFSNRLKERFPEHQLAFLHLVRDLLATRFAIAFSWEDAPSNHLREESARD